MHLQLTTMPKMTPITKSQTVMQIMMLAIVIYSMLDFGEYGCVEQYMMHQPAHAVPCVPQGFFDEVDSQYEDEGANHHNSCKTR